MAVPALPQLYQLKHTRDALLLFFADEPGMIRIRASAKGYFARENLLEQGY